MATMVNMLDAKSQLSRLVAAVERGDADEIIIARNGKAAARLVPIAQRPVGRRLGLMDGQWQVPSDIYDYDAEIAGLFDHGR